MRTVLGAWPGDFPGADRDLQGQNLPILTGGFLIFIKAGCLFCLLTEFSMVTSIQLFGKTLDMCMFTRYFHTLDLSERYPPGGCRGDALRAAPSALLFHVRTRAWRGDTRGRDGACRAGDSQNQRQVPGGLVFFSGPSCTVW